MSAPISPGGRSKVSASRSAATATSAPRCVRGLDQGRQVTDGARACRGTGPARRTTVAGRLGQHSRSTRHRSRRQIDLDDPSPAARRGSHHGERLREARRASTTQTRPRDLTAGPAHSVIASAAAVASSSMRRAGRRSAGEVGHDGLEVEQRLEPALADLRLVRRVGGVPGRVLQHVAADDRRGDACRSSRDRSSTSGRVLRAASARSSAMHLGLGAARSRAAGRRSGWPAARPSARASRSSAGRPVSGSGRPGQLAEQRRARTTSRIRRTCGAVRTDVPRGERQRRARCQRATGGCRRSWRLPGDGRRVAPARRWPPRSVAVTGSRAASPARSCVPESFRGVLPLRRPG